MIQTDSRICVYPAGETDFSTNGLGCISPTKCTVHWEENGEYSLEIEHPIDEWGKYLRISAYDRTVVAPVPESPSMALRQTQSSQSVGIYRITGGRVRLRTGPGTNYKRLKTLRKNTRMTVLSTANSNWYEVIAPNGQHGYMSAKYLKKVEDSTISSVVTEIRRDVAMREQPFDIYSWSPGTRQVTAKARHVFYRLAENIVCGPLKIENMTAQQALDAAFAAAENQGHGFRWYCEDTEACSMENEIEGRNLADVILGDGGICDTYGLKLLADWFDLFLVKDVGMDRGVQIRYGKNLEEMSGGFDVSNVVTRVIPVGQTKDGAPLYLGDGAERYLTSENEGLFARPRYGVLKCSEARVDGKTDGVKITQAKAREMMRAAAQAELDAGCDLPECSINAVMAQLRRDPACAEYATLENVCPGDILGLFVPDFGLTLNIRVCAYDFDALNQGYDEITLGTPSVNTSKTGISSRQLGGGSVTSSKLAYGAVSSSALQKEIISTRHLQAGSVNADAIQADSITADKIASGAITADKVKANALDAITIDAIKAKINEIVSNKLTTDDFYAALADITVLAAGTATFDQATVEHLISSAMNLEFGEAGTVYINNLAVRYAQLMHATIADLCIKANDGNYYTLDVNQSGHVTAVKSTITDGEISMGETFGGKIILETNMTVENLNTSNLLGTYALINKIDAAKIDVGELFAREAFIALLRTTRIIGDKSLTLIAEQSQQASRCFRDSAEPTGTNGAKAGDIWIQPDSGSTYQAESAEDAKLKFAIDREGNLYFSAEDEDVEFETDDFDLFVSGLRISENPDGTLTVPFRWVLVQDESMLASIQHNKDSLDRVIRIDTNGLHVGDSESDNEVLVDSDSVNVVIGGQKYSKFAGRYVQFGNYKIGLADDNGLMFKPL